jgi:formaldehyde-activating enzyme involved in methanogenesis
LTILRHRENGGCFLARRGVLLEVDNESRFDVPHRRSHGVRRTTKLAIHRAMNNEPSVDTLIANRHTIKHDMDDWS